MSSADSHEMSQEEVGGEMTPSDNPIGCEVDDIQYTVEESPPWYLCILFGFQHYISMFIATLTVPFLLTPVICMDGDDVGKTEVIGTLFVASGLVTLLQSFLGIRLPIVQAGTFALLAPTLAYFSLPAWQCPNIVPADHPSINASLSSVGFGTHTSIENTSYIVMGSPAHKEVWKTRLREVQGSLMVAALFEALLGVTGAVGTMLRFIGPLSICPTVSLLGLSLFKSAAAYGAHQWWICLLTIFLMVLFSQYLGWVRIPCASYSKEGGCSKTYYPFFKMFPVILAIAVAWFTCYVLTVTDVLPAEPGAWGRGARTDLRAQVIVDSAWFRVPYPLQWGLPTVSLSCVCGLLSGILATTVESVGDYHACARLSGAPCPPTHAINRGIFIEGIGSMLDGLFGTGNGTTSTSINVGVIGLTKVGSRRVVQYSAVFMIALGVFTKFGALFITVPDPVIGGSFFILFGMIVAVGISSLQYVDLNSSRNLFIIGFSFLMGLSLPQWVKSNPNAINTGNFTVDQALQVLLSTSMFVGGMIGFIFDNTIPGTLEERGLAHWNKMRSSAICGQSPELARRIAAIYDLPIGMNLIKRFKFSKYIPICPTYGKDEKLLTPEEIVILQPADGQHCNKENGADITAI